MTDEERIQAFRHNLLDLLKDTGNQQIDVARAIGVSQQTFNTWCRGIALPRAGKIEKLAAFFGVRESDLLIPHDSHSPFSSSSLAAAQFSKILRSLRKARSLTQDELAERLCITKQALSHYERGTRYPKKETLEAIADFFDVGIDYLVGRSLSQCCSSYSLEDAHLLELFHNATPQARDAVILTLESNQIVKSNSPAV